MPLPPAAPTWLTHGWRACWAPPPPCQLPPERASGFRVSPPAPTPELDQGVTLSVLLPHWGCLPTTGRSLPIGKLVWERSRGGQAGAGAQARPGLGPTLLLREPEGFRPGAFVPEGHPPWGPESTYRRGRGLCLPPAIAVETEPGGEGGGRSRPLEKRSLRKERRANRDTDILIRGSVRGVFIIQFRLAAWRPVSTRARAGSHASAEARGRPQAVDESFALCGRLRPGRGRAQSGDWWGRFLG